jgi:hypothetical protein
MREDIPAAKITAPVRALTLASISDFQPTALMELQESCRREACPATSISLVSDGREPAIELPKEGFKREGEAPHSK